MTKITLLLTALLAMASLSLKADDQSGLVAVICVTDESGQVIEATVKKSTNSVLDKPATDALQNWKFKPAKIAGKAVKAKVTVPVRFGA